MCAQIPIGLGRVPKNKLLISAFHGLMHVYGLDTQLGSLLQKWHDILWALTEKTCPEGGVGPDWLMALAYGRPGTPWPDLLAAMADEAGGMDLIVQALQLLGSRGHKAASKVATKSKVARSKIRQWWLMHGNARDAERMFGYM